MEYLILLYTQPEAWESKSETEMQGVMEEHGKLIADLQAAGKFRGGNALEWGAAATTVRVRNGQSLVTDGPFAETKEQLGGYYHVEADDLDDAMAIAARIPDARVGGVEIRPVKDVSM